MSDRRLRKTHWQGMHALQLPRPRRTLAAVSFREHDPRKACANAQNLLGAFQKSVRDLIESVVSSPKVNVHSAQNTNAKPKFRIEQSSSSSRIPIAIRLTEQNSCRTSVYLRSRNPSV